MTISAYVRAKKAGIRFASFRFAVACSQWLAVAFEYEGGGGAAETWWRRMRMTAHDGIYILYDYIYSVYIYYYII